MPDSKRSGIIGSVLGNVLEWYDYALFGGLSIFISKNFFPAQNPLISKLSTFSVFAIGFVARPIGAMIFGPMGDRIGREKSLFFSLALMAISTTIIGCLPSYFQIGALSPVILVTMRLFQGIAIGGAYAGAMVYLVENAPPSKRGFYGSWTEFGCVLGTLVGGQLAVVAMSFLLGQQQLDDWGWRVPFLIAIFTLFAGNYVLKSKNDQKQTISIKPKEKKEKRSVVSDIIENKVAALCAVAITAFSGVSFYILLVFLPNYIATSGIMSVKDSFLATGIANLFMVPAVLVSGIATDKFGRKPVMTVGIICIILSGLPLFLTAKTSLIYAHVALQIFYALSLSTYYGGRAAFFAESFPANVRCTAVALVIGVGQAVFGGTAPFVATFLTAKFGGLWVVYPYIFAVSVLALYAMSKIPDRTRMPLI